MSFLLFLQEELTRLTLMANITKKVSWSSRADDSNATGEGTPLLNGSEQYCRQVGTVRQVGTADRSVLQTGRYCRQVCTIDRSVL